MKRLILDKLKQWKTKKNRKPLILRGARQVGKTTAVNLFAQQFPHFINLNLDIASDRSLFNQDLDIDELIKAIFFHKGKSQTDEPTLLFIDEIQNSPNAVAMLRYFYEKKPDLHVICAGSLLESLIDTHISFPVGRVEYEYLFPVSFEEFLLALNETEAYNMLQATELPPQYAHKKLLQLFHQYAMIGGMPEVVEHYSQHKDLVALTNLYNNLIVSYEDDVEKYASHSRQAQIIRFLIKQAPLYASNRIQFEKFGQSNYSSRDIGEALRTLEKAMLLHLCYPTTSIKPPFERNFKRSPRLQFLDTGLINYSVGLQKEFFHLQDLNNLYQGKISEHIVGQQLICAGAFPRNDPLFWIREKTQSNAEIDFTVIKGSELIPIEVKSGKSGSLRSLHSFMDYSQHNTGLRLSANYYQKIKAKSLAGKSYQLINLPYYLSGTWLAQMLELNFLI